MSNVFKATVAIIISLLMITSCQRLSRHTLRNTLEEVNYRYPMLVEPGVVADSAFIEDKNVVYRYRVDETQFHLLAVKEISPQQQLENLTSKGPEMRELLRTVRRSGYGFSQRYTGSGTGITVECTIPHELLDREL